MPSAHAHAQGDEGDQTGGRAVRDRPIDLVDIGLLLGASAHAERPGAPVRAWRDDLTLIRNALSYARSILAADVAILSRAGAPQSKERPAVVDELPNILAGGPSAEEWSQPDDEGGDLEFDEGLFVRADHLLALHGAMAGVDLSSPAATGRIREQMEEQLDLLTERQAAVEARLQQIRAAIIRAYQAAVAPARDQPA
ncbi:MAG: hypothetical protein WAL61_13795 [Acidimicrobiales bacterium]